MFAGKPPPTVTWYRNDNFVNNKSVTVHHRDGVIRSDIEIKNLGRADVRLELTCNATNNNRSLPLSSTVRVDMNCKYSYRRFILHTGQNIKLRNYT